MNSDGTDDLVRRSTRGDSRAFASLISQYEKPALSAAYAVLGDAAAAGDVVQESFLSAWRNLSDLESPAVFGAWLLRIVRNRSIDLKRQQKRRNTGAIEIDPADPRPGPTGELIAGESSDQLERALARLDRQTRAAIVMRYYEQLSSKEIAERLQCSPAAVDMRLNRGRTRLRELLTEPAGSLLQQT